MKTPAQMNFHGLSRREVQFVVLFALGGFSGAESYATAFESKASLNSCAAMASRLLRENRMLCALGILDHAKFNLSPKALKLIKLI